MRPGALFCPNCPPARSKVVFAPSQSDAFGIAGSFLLRCIQAALILALALQLAACALAGSIDAETGKGPAFRIPTPAQGDALCRSLCRHGVSCVRPGPIRSHRLPTALPLGGFPDQTGHGCRANRRRPQSQHQRCGHGGARFAHPCIGRPQLASSNGQQGPANH